MKFLLTLEDYTLNREFKVARIIKDILLCYGINVKVQVDYEKPIRRLILTCDADLDVILNALRSIPEVSKIILIYFECLPCDLSLIKSKCLEAARKLVDRYGMGSFKVEVKKLWNDFAISSLDLCRIIGAYIREKLGLKVDVRDPFFTLYVQLGRSGVLIGGAPTKFYRKLRKAISSNFFDKFVVVFESPRTVYEIMDMLRLCASMNVELRIVGGSEGKIKRALDNLGGIAKHVKLKLCSSLDEALTDVFPIGFSSSGFLNENDLIDIVRRNFNVRFGFLIGNEYEGLSINARNRVKYLIKLGPSSNFSMRSSTAAAYILGLMAGLLLRGKLNRNAYMV